MELLKKLKVIFLDFDGVLLSMKTLREKHMKIIRGEHVADNDAFDALCVANLNMILEYVPEAMIVISSSWRKLRDLPALSKMLQDNGIDPHRLIDKTPELGGKRGSEIQAWLNANSDVKDYIILDDDSDMLPKQKVCFIKVNGQEGLTTNQALLGINLLNVK